MLSRYRPPVASTAPAQTAGCVRMPASSPSIGTNSTYSPVMNPAAQFLVTGVCATLMLPALPSGEAVRAALWPMVYLGPVAVGVAFTLQVVGQRTAPPAHAAVILSMEGLFAAVFGALIGDERLAWGQYAGCGLMLGGILLAQWPEFMRRNAVPTGEKTDETPGHSC